MSPELARREDELTRKGTYNLTPFEQLWKARQPHLLHRGYSLRPRYAPDWQPSWIGTNIQPHYCEDSIVSRKLYVIDAIAADGTLVAIKSVQNSSEEANIAQFLTSLLERPDNHCASVIEVFPDPTEPSRSLMVMPYLRPFNDPVFEVVGEVVEFISQMLEGLAFMHSTFVAHRDIAAPNIMVDGRPLFPDGHHPVRRNRSPDLLEKLTPLRRIDHDIKYFYIDFGLSVRFTPGASSYVVGNVGRDAEVPELSRTVPYDAYKADIYALGNLFYQEIQQKYRHTEFLEPLVVCMKQRQPDLRPPAGELVNMFKLLCRLGHPSKLRWRLSPRSESASERMLNDTIAAARNGLSNLKQFVS